MIDGKMVSNIKLHTPDDYKHEKIPLYQIRQKMTAETFIIIKKMNILKIRTYKRSSWKKLGRSRLIANFDWKPNSIALKTYRYWLPMTLTIIPKILIPEKRIPSRSTSNSAHISTKAIDKIRFFYCRSRTSPFCVRRCRLEYLILYFKNERSQ